MLALTILAAFVAQTHAATDVTTVEDNEAIDLINTLVDDNKNDELVDMIADKLITKLLGLPAIAIPPQQVAMLGEFQAPNFRAMMTDSPQLMTAPAVKYDSDKLTKIDPDRKAVVTQRVWGTTNKLVRNENPYSNIAFPSVGDRPTNTNLQPRASPKNSYKPGPDYANFGSSEYERLKGKDGFGAARDMDKALDYLQGVDRGNAPKLDEVEEGPDAMTVIAVGLVSALIGSAATLAAFYRLGFAKSGMHQPLLNQ